MKSPDSHTSEHQAKRHLSPLVKWLIAGLIAYLAFQAILSKQTIPC